MWKDLFFLQPGLFLNPDQGQIHSSKVGCGIIRMWTCKLLTVATALLFKLLLTQSEKTAGAWVIEERRGEESINCLILFSQNKKEKESIYRHLRRCWMMWSIVGLNRAFMASGLILNMPWDDHFTKSTLHTQTKKKDWLVLSLMLIIITVLRYLGTSEQKHNIVNAKTQILSSIQYLYTTPRTKFPYLEGCIKKIKIPPGSTGFAWNLYMKLFCLDSNCLWVRGSFLFRLIVRFVLVHC